MGVSRDTFEAATRGVEPDLTLPDLDLPGRQGAPPRGQAEFVQTPADYIKRGQHRPPCRAGQEALPPSIARTLAAIEQKFGVPGNVLLAIWGRETAFGGYKLPKNAITVLATQGYYGRRKDMFKQELLYAFKMLEEGHVKLADMRASWGGAMGLTQFLPSEFYKHAVDFDGDGKKDIWHSVPDALASAAQQLVNKGWQRGVHWAYEVRAPQERRLHAGRSRSHPAARRMAQAGIRAGLWTQAVSGGTDRAGVAAAAGGHLRPVLPDAEELLRDQGIQFLRSLCAVRRPLERAHRRSAPVRDAVEQGHATAHRRGRNRCSAR